MEYISVKEAADKWGLTARMVNYYCVDGRIKGARKIANVWTSPGTPPNRRTGEKETGTVKDLRSR